MEVQDAIIVAVKVAGKNVLGRTAIQMLSSMDFLSEKVETSETTGYSVPENWKRYLYSVSTDGEQFFKDVKRSDSEEIAEISRKVESK